MVGWDLTGGEAVLIPSTPKRSRPVSKDELRRPPTHDWSIYPKQRLLLFYIDRRYESDLDDITTIFNFAFSEILTEGRLPKGKLSAQIYESATWQISYVEDLLSLPDEFLPRKFNKIDEIVTESAQALGLTLARRTGPSRVETSKRSLKRKERALTTGIDSDSSVDVSIYDSDTKTESISRAIKRTARSFHITSPKGSRTKTSTLENVAGLLTPPQTALSRKRKAESGPNACHDRNLLPAIAFSTPEISSITSTHTHDASRAVRHKSSRSAGIPSHDGVPYLLFRYWDATSHGTNSAAGFVSGLRIRTTPLLDTDPDFLRHASAHLWNDRITPQSSPFISFTTSLPTALRKAAAKIEAGGSPMIAVLDGRAVAMQTRLYHTKVAITNIRSQGLPLPRYPGGGEFEYWAWQEANAIVGYVSLGQFHQWTQGDDYLGALLRQNDISGKGGVPRFREACRNALGIDGALGRSISSLARLFRPKTTQYDPFLKDFARVTLQNFNLTEGVNAWETNASFMDGLLDSSKRDITAQHAATSQRGDHDSDEGFEDVDDVLEDVGDTPVETENASITQNGLQIITIEDDDDDDDIIAHAMMVDQSSQKHTGMSNVRSEPRPQTCQRAQSRQIPLAHRTRSPFTASDELTISLPPSPYDKIREEMRIAAQQASPTPAPRSRPSMTQSSVEVPAMPVARLFPIGWNDQGAFDKYVRRLVMDVLAEKGSGSSRTRNVKDARA